MAEGTEKEGLLKKAEEFLSVFKKGEAFTKELLRENERLRFKLAELEGVLSSSATGAGEKILEARIAQLEGELSAIRERFSEVEEENKDFAAKYLEVEEENNNLANLYVASYQLHSTLDFNEVLKTVLEIIINLIGAEHFSIYLLEDKTNDLIPVAAEGVSFGELPKCRFGEGLIGGVAKSGESHFSEALNSGDGTSSPVVCIPLKIKEHVIGVIAIYSVLVQKKGFSHMDYELFNLLAGHAATAIFSSRLYTQSERKLTTIQSFLDLLKEKKK